MQSSKAKVEKSVEPKPVDIKRRYAEDMEIDSDLFKLEVNTMLKNLGYDDKKPVLENVPHCHFYRTFDSNGRKLGQCSSIGGHTHEIKVVVTESGLLDATCSPAMGAKFNDSHSHDIVYLRSDKIQRRQFNKEAQEYIAKMEKPV